MQWFNTSMRYWLGFAALLLACFFAVQKFAGYSLVRVNLHSSYSTEFKVYWQTSADYGWTEANSAFVNINDRRQRYVVLLPVPLASITKLRFDPSNHADVVTRINRISLHSLYSKAIAYGGINNDSFSGFKPSEHTQMFVRDRTIKLNSTGNDAGFIVDFPGADIQPEPILRISQSLILAFLIFSLARRFTRLTERLRWVPLGLLVAACAALAMASVSNINTHPDELTHINNAKYYAVHYLPPQVCSAESRYTYSDYGISRLDKREIAYYLAGRYLQLTAFIPAPDYLKLRYLNVVLFFILVLLAFRQRVARYLFLPLLLTPQAWYLFSYYNSDALSLFVVAITAHQLFVPKSILRRLLNGERPPGYWVAILGLVLLVAMQYWLKLNFMFYPLMLFMLAASWWLLNRRWPISYSTWPLIVALILGTSTFLSWQVTRYAVNDYNLAARVYDCSELTAVPAFKPSTPLANTASTILLHDKGVSLREMLVEKKWAQQIYYTGLGAYGYLEFLNSDTHNRLVSAFIILFFLYVVAMVTIRGDGMARMAVLSTIAAIVGITIAAIINNWFQSFQPQGRYLIVYLPMLGTLIAMYTDKLNVVWLTLLASVPFLLGLYSFFAVGLMEIPK